MRVVILAGGRGSRLGGETELRPKPLVEIGGRPILRHVMDRYAAAGYRDFLIATGYKGEMIRDYFERAFAQEAQLQGWSVRVEDTGPDTPRGGRLKRLVSLLGEGPFLLSWADGLADVDFRALETFHRAHGGPATIMAVHPPARFGQLLLEGDRVVHYAEKPGNPEEWISGGVFVLDRAVVDRMADDVVDWERGPLEELARAGQLRAYRHGGFWQCMDTARDRERLESLWHQGRAPWKNWQP